MKILALTGGLNVPSARFRIRQNIEPLKRYNIDLIESYSFLGTYPSENKIFRPLWGVANIFENSFRVFKSFKYDCVILQREFLSSHFTLEGLTKKPRILDVDDAIWLQSNEKFAKKLASICNVVICGNDYLAEKFLAWNKNTLVVPTAVETNKFKPSSNTQDSKKKIICWSGTYGGFEYLYPIEDSLRRVLNNFPNAVLRIVSDRYPNFKTINSDRIEFIKWSPENESSVLQDIDVGIMPLAENEWSKGKCSYKMLTYMSCAKPVIVTPIGMNLDVLNKGEVGFSALNNNDWFNKLCLLLNDTQLAVSMGHNGRQVIQDFYSVEKISYDLSLALSSAI